MIADADADTDYYPTRITDADPDADSEYFADAGTDTDADTIYLYSYYISRNYLHVWNKI